MNRYNLTNAQIKGIANLAVQENETAVGAEVSLMANLFELQSQYTNIYDYIRNSGWFSKAAYWMDNGESSTQDVAITRDVLISGNRLLPAYVNEHDAISDVTSVSNNGTEFNKKDRSKYKKDVTVIKNRYGSTYTFYDFPGSRPDLVDPFGYTADAYQKLGNAEEKVVVSTASAISLAKKLLRMNQNETMTGYTPQGKQYFVDADAYYTTPKKGDVVYFYSSSKGRIGHTGIVTKVNSKTKTFNTIEGNTTSSEYSENGGCVAKHSYSYATVGGKNRVNGFGRPAFKQVGVTSAQFVNTAISYDGYMEKASNKNLDSKTANVGSNNFQRFQRDVGAGNGDQWCQYFVSAIALYTCQKYCSSESEIETPTESSTLNTTRKFTGYVTASSLNVRDWAGTENKTVSFSPLYRGAKVYVCDTIKADNGSDWYYIKYNGKYGFVSAKYIKH